MQYRPNRSPCGTESFIHSRPRICSQPDTAVASIGMDSAPQHCHRCNAALTDSGLYCPACGAPQLVLTEFDTQRIAESRAAQPADGMAQSTPQSGKVPIRWRPVLRIAAALAISAAVVSGLSNLLAPLTFLAFLLIFLAPTLALSFYQRQVGGASMSAGVGARIGIALGIFMGFALSTEEAINDVIQRYPLHHAAQMDAILTAALAKMAASISSYPGMNDAAAGTATQQMLALFQSPDVRAASALAGGAMLACSILIYCVLSGALMGWLRPMRVRRPAA